MKVATLLGITGVSTQENPLARQWAKRLEWPMLGVVLWIPIQWYLEETGFMPPLLGRMADWMVWQVFLFETILLTSLVKDKQRYLLGNWMNLLIIVGGLPIVWEYTPLIGLLRSLRLLLVLILLFRLSRTLRLLLVRNQLGTTLIISFVVVMLSGIVVTRLDHSIGSIWDGMWWAWVTVSTVGYGDIVPHSTAGRVFGAFLILLGVVMVSLLTANLSAFLIGGDVEKVEHEEREEGVLLREMAQRLERVEKLLEQQAGAKAGSAKKATGDARPD